MTRDNTGTWVEYEEARVSDVDSPTILRTFPTEIAALRSAVDNGNKATKVLHGQTIDEALSLAKPTLGRAVQAAIADQVPVAKAARKPAGGDS